MFCKNCGAQLSENSAFCSSCGTKQDFENVSLIKRETSYVQEQRHDVPKCTCCGHIGEWEIGPVLRGIDWIIGGAFTLFGVFPGLAYFGVVAAIRSDKDKREKICKNCKAKNLFTFFY